MSSPICKVCSENFNENSREIVYCACHFKCCRSCVDIYCKENDGFCRHCEMIFEEAIIKKVPKFEDNEEMFWKFINWVDYPECIDYCNFFCTKYPECIDYPDCIYHLPERLRFHYTTEQLVILEKYFYNFYNKLKLNLKCKDDYRDCNMMSYVVTMGKHNYFAVLNKDDCFMNSLRKKKFSHNFGWFFFIDDKVENEAKCIKEVSEKIKEIDSIDSSPEIKTFIKELVKENIILKNKLTNSERNFIIEHTSREEENHKIYKRIKNIN